MVFIDIHCHLDFCNDVPSIIKRAISHEVRIIITHGVNPKSNRSSLEFSGKYSEVKSALGLYPIDALKLSDSEIEKELTFIEENKDNIFAIGEVGMDFKEDLKEHERQQKIFEKLIALSIRINKPIIVHSRKAEKECIDLLEKLEAKKVIMHCFCGKWELVEGIVRNNWFISLPANVKSSQQFQRIARDIPIERLFCETDSPYLHPDKLPNNEPSFVIESYRKIAELKNLSLSDVEKAVSYNFEALLKA